MEEQTCGWCRKPDYDGLRLMKEARSRKQGARMNANFAYKKTELGRTDVHQYGGVEVVTTNKVTPNCISRGQIQSQKCGLVMN
jgi:hypothetical protein